MIQNLIFVVYLLISDFLVPQLTQHYEKYTPVTQPKTCSWLLSAKTFALCHF